MCGNWGCGPLLDKNVNAERPGPRPAPASVEAVDLPRGQIFGETVDQGAPGLEAEMAGVRRAGLRRDPIDLGEARRAALDEGAADRVCLRPVFAEQPRERRVPDAADGEPLAEVDVAEAVDVDPFGR